MRSWIVMIPHQTFHIIALIMLSLWYYWFNQWCIWEVWRHFSPPCHFSLVDRLFLCLFLMWSAWPFALAFKQMGGSEGEIWWPRQKLVRGGASNTILVKKSVVPSRPCHLNGPKGNGFHTLDKVFHEEHGS